MMFIQKSNGNGTMSTDEIVNLFESTENLEEIKRAVESGEERVVVTWATVEMKDNAGEIIPIEDKLDEVIRSQETLLKRHGPISDEHTNKIVGETLAYKIMEHPDAKALGILHLNKMHNDNPADDTVWEEIQSGERKGSSVGGVNTSLSLGKDNVTGDKVTVLDGFEHMETASVKDPCNPLALNEAFSVVAKSNRGDNMKSVTKSEVDNALNVLKKASEEYGPHQHDEKNPKGLHSHSELEKNKQKGEYKEEKGADKEPKQEIDINKEDITKDKLTNNKLKKGDTMPNENSELMERLAKLEGTVEKLSKQDPEEEVSEETKEEDEAEVVVVEEKSKQDDEDEAVDKKKAEDEEEVTDKKKENAASDVEGLSDAPSPDSPVVEDSNDQDAEVQKKMVAAEVKKQLSRLKVSTPRPMGNQGTTDVNKKAQDYGNLPMQLATGKKKLGYQEVLKSVAENDPRYEVM